VQKDNSQGPPFAAKLPEPHALIFELRLSPTESCGRGLTRLLSGGVPPPAMAEQKLPARPPKHRPPAPPLMRHRRHRRHVAPLFAPTSPAIQPILLPSPLSPSAPFSRFSLLDLVFNCLPRNPWTVKRDRKTWPPADPSWEGSPLSSKGIGRRPTNRLLRANHWSVVVRRAAGNDD
jgi:hypothetical protein